MGWGEPRGVTVDEYRHAQALVHQVGGHAGPLDTCDEGACPVMRIKAETAERIVRGHHPPGG